MKRSYTGVTRALLGALVLSLALTASASAHEFFVAGHALTGSEAVTGISPAGSIAKIETTFGSTKLASECTSLTYTGNLETLGKTSGEFHFSGCIVTGAPHCTAPSTTFKAINSLMSYSKSALGLEIAPASGTVLFNLVWNGAECAFKGIRNVTGKPACELTAAETEQVEHELVCKTPQSDILVASNPGAIVAVEKLKLTSGKAWSAK
jgi:hypothetical protein